MKSLPISDWVFANRLRRPRNVLGFRPRRVALVAVLAMLFQASPLGNFNRLTAGALGEQRATAQTSYSHGDPTPAEQFMLELVNRARANPAAEATRFGIDLNEGISANTISATPKQPLAFNVEILQAARAHSQWMLDNDIFAHFEDGGIGPKERMVAAGYVFNGNWTYGENIGWRGSSPNFPPVGPTVAQEHEDLFVDAGIEERGHRVNLMQGAFKEVGTGVQLGVFTVGGNDFNAVMITQDFGTTGANPFPFLVGVVYRDTDGDGAYSVGEGLAGVTVTPASGSYFAVTSTSGGYAIPLDSGNGSIQVTFSGGPLPSPISQTVTLAGQNLKLDLETSSIPAVFGFVPGSTRRTAGGMFQADLYGPPNTSVTVESSEDLSHWTTRTTANLTGANIPFTDAQSGGLSARFYRAVKN